ncbi:MAG: hypothetical protein WD009_01210 [Phycisphaeraceae bacterium]
MDETRDRWVPLVLLTVGVAALGPVLAIVIGVDGRLGRWMLIGALTYLVLGTALGIVALLIAGHFLGVNYGRIGTVALKLAGTFAMTSVIRVLVAPVGCMGMLITLAVFLGLLQYLFELEPVDLIWTALIIWLVQVAAFVLLTNSLLAGG